MDAENIKNNVQKSDTWVRGIHMVILFIALRITEIILYAIIIFQFGTTLFTGKKHVPLEKLSISLTHYIKNILLYLSFNSEQRPFPFAEWEESIK